AGVPASEVEHVIHATTLVGNAVIQHVSHGTAPAADGLTRQGGLSRGARTALVTTKGFRDILTTGREFRYDIYESHLAFPKPIVPRRWRIEVDERITATGQVLTPLAPAEIDRAVQQLAAGQYEAVAVCLLHSYANPTHEQQLVAAIENAIPDVAVSASSDILAQVGEFERLCATTINAFVQPLVREYLARLEAGLARLGFGGELYVLASNGGLLTVKTAGRYPVRLLESGPVAGALGAGLYGMATERPDLLSFDMGGTTAKACVVRGGAPSATNEFEVARVQRLSKGSGLPIRLPSTDMIEIGAGGGSLARIDQVGLISVGPDSAGAEPGPICYGRGGTQPTVTDANVVLGYLNPDYFLGGAMRLDLAATEAALDALGAKAGLTAVRAAWGIHEIVSQNMANALRTHSIEKGVDYRSFALIAFGGAGPVHAYRIATLLRAPTVIFPWGAGVFSALGMLAAPLRFDLVRTAPTRLDALDARTIGALYEELRSELLGLFDEAGVPREAIELTLTVDMRYVGQGTEIEVPLGDSWSETARPDDLAVRFKETYAQLYGWALESAPIEAVSWRCSARGPAPRFGLATQGAPRSGDAQKGTRRVYLSDELGFQECAVYDRYLLPVGAQIEGPALVEERECTIYVGSGATATVDHFRGIVMTLPA
ncbi:MAG: hydantoinase/oxoprolinase family protein, partial [Chloroflexi bacterium]|nr:hydantoinase/oxoprolinase family protein [Chloroflexota bacterium]